MNSALYKYVLLLLCIIITKAINNVLSGFIFSLLFENHDCISDIQSCILEIVDSSEIVFKSK